MIQTFLIIALSVCGFFVAKYIRRHKKQNTPLVCPIRFDCHTVVHSDYAKFLGVPVEILGMTYYAFIAIFYSAMLILNYILVLNSIYELPEPIVFLLLPLFALLPLLSLVAFLFSTYLIGVQIFILKKGCSWCIVSAIISAIIFALVFFF